MVDSDTGSNAEAGKPVPPVGGPPYPPVGGPPVPPVGGPYAWYVLALLVLVYVMNFIDRQIMSILAEDIKRDLGLSDSELGFLYGTAFAVFYALFGVPIGRLADNWVRTRLLALGLTLWSGMTALSGLASSFSQLSLARPVKRCLSLLRSRPRVTS